MLQNREYVKLEKKRFIPADVGMVVSDLLVNHFSKYVDYGFTSYLEDQLDAISRGEAEWKPAVLGWWKPFIELIRVKEAEVKKSDVTTEKTEEICPDCGKQLVIKLGKYGRFFACSAFPDCRYVRPLPGENNGATEAAQITEEKCDTCGAPLLLRQGKYGQFYGCTKYPDCKFIRPLTKPISTGVKCPDCSVGEILEKKSRRGKIFYSCSQYPRCTFASWDRPIDEHCPQCESLFLVENNTKRWGSRIKCPNKSCKYSRAGRSRRRIKYLYPFFARPKKRYPQEKAPSSLACGSPREKHKHGVVTNSPRSVGPQTCDSFFPCSCVSLGCAATGLKTRLNSFLIILEYQLKAIVQK